MVWAWKALQSVGMLTFKLSMYLLIRNNDRGWPGDGQWAPLPVVHTTQLSGLSLPWGAAVSDRYADNVQPVGASVQRQGTVVFCRTVLIEAWPSTWTQAVVAICVYIGPRQKFFSFLLFQNQVSAPVLQVMPERASVTFEDIVFGYSPGKEILQGLSFTVPAGKKVAIVGGSGSGWELLPSHLTLCSSVVHSAGGHLWNPEKP